MVGVSVICARDLLLDNMGKCIGNREGIKLWEEPWLSTTTARRPMGPSDLITNVLTVAELIIANTGKWNREKS